LINEPWRAQVETELKWLAGLLGEVRDLDILMARLREGATELDLKGVEQYSLAPLFTSVETRRTQSSRRVAETLEGDRYHALILALEQGAAHPSLTDTAALPCRAVLPSAAKTAWRRLRAAASDLRNNDPPANFHEARKRAKSCRYTAELIAPMLGRRAQRDASDFIRLTARVQDALGEHQDALITANELESALAGYPDDSTLAGLASELLADQRKRARTARARFFKVWSKLDHKKRRRWMRPRSEGEPPETDEPVEVRINGVPI
jgi:CHAD domain-containing protein